MRLATSAISIAALVVGCDQPPPKKTVFDAQVQALKKARAVEGQIKQAAEQRREQESEEPAR